MDTDRILRLTIATGMLFSVASATGCSGSGGSGAGAGGRSGATSTGGTLASSTGGATVTGGIVAGGLGGMGGTSDGSGGATTTNTSSDAGSPYTNRGVQGERGQATADATSFTGYEERYIKGIPNGLGDDVCVVRFDLKRVGDAPAGCTVCTWSHLIEYSNPQIMTNIDGVCALSDLALTSDTIQKIIGTRVAIGFASHPGGAHGSARMKYFESTQTWDVDGNATWDGFVTPGMDTLPTDAFGYDSKKGYCYYGP
jgi:hypothetical protein